MGLNYQNYSIFSNIESDEGIEDRVGPTEVDTLEVTEVSPLAHDAHPILEGRPEPKKTNIEPELLECPNCGNTITITVTKRPLKIKCPHCGIEGIIQ